MPRKPSPSIRKTISYHRHGDYGHAYYGAATIANELEAIMQQADVYRERNGWLNAALIYRTVLNELRAQHEQIYDHDGDLGYELLSLADVFVAHGHDTIAEGLVWERAGASKDTRLDGWLKKQAVNSGDWGKAIEYAENQFWQRPSVDYYQEIKAIAEKVGDWPKRQASILSRLIKQEEYGLLTRIHLLEKDVAALARLAGRAEAGRIVETLTSANADMGPNSFRRFPRQYQGIEAGPDRDNPKYVDNPP
jgi:hypothetical protein